MAGIAIFDPATGTYRFQKTNPSGGSYTFNSPLSESGGVVSIKQATTSQGGYLSSTDWNTFNNKFSTPTGTIAQYIRGDGSLDTFPTIPTVPTLISAFTNDVGYITSASIPTVLSAFTNDVGYITSSALTGLVAGSGVMDRLTYWDSGSTISYLSTTTYPDLTELSYVKGVTSAIQTQINAKITGTIANTQIAYGSGTSIAGSANLTYASNILNVKGTLQATYLSGTQTVKVYHDGADAYIQANDATTNSLIFQLISGKVIRPSVNNSIGLGQFNYNWSNVYTNKLQLQYGTAASPSLTFQSAGVATNTGLYYSATQLNVAVSGGLVGEFQTTGLRLNAKGLTFGGSAPVANTLSWGGSALMSITSTNVGLVLTTQNIANTATSGYSVISPFNPTSGSSRFASILASPTTNAGGTYTGDLAGFAVAMIRTTTTGNHYLLDLGTTVTSYTSGYTPFFRVFHDGRVWAGTAPTTQRQFNLRNDQNTATISELENLDTGVSAQAIMRVLSDTTQTALQSHGSGRTATRYGISLGGASEIYSNLGTSLLIGTANSAPVYIGTNNTLAMTIDTSQYAIFSQRVGIGNTPTALLDVGASTTSLASIRVRTGVTPTSPNAGDLYSDGTDAYMYLASTWKSLTSGGGSSPVVQYITNTATIADDTTIAYIDMNSGIYTVSLPATPAIGHSITLVRTDAYSYNYTLSGNGNNVNGSASITGGNGQYTSMVATWDDTNSVWNVQYNPSTTAQRIFQGGNSDINAGTKMDIGNKNGGGVRFYNGTDFNCEISNTGIGTFEPDTTLPDIHNGLDTDKSVGLGDGGTFTSSTLLEVPLKHYYVFDISSGDLGVTLPSATTSNRTIIKIKVISQNNNYRFTITDYDTSTDMYYTHSNGEIITLKAVKVDTWYEWRILDIEKGEDKVVKGENKTIDLYTTGTDYLLIPKRPDWAENKNYTLTVLRAWYRIPTSDGAPDTYPTIDIGSSSQPDYIVNNATLDNFDTHWHAITLDRITELDITSDDIIVRVATPASGEFTFSATAKIMIEAVYSNNTSI